MDQMLANLSRMRSYVGSVQNSLESKMSYIDVAIENVTASRSRIVDTDVAERE